MVALAMSCFAVASDEQAAIPVLTVCQALRGANQYSGRTVIVVGRAVDAAEGGWIDEGCGLVLAFGDRKFPAAISTSYDADETAAPPALPKGFKWDKRAIERALAEVQTTSHLEPKAYWCAIYAGSKSLAANRSRQRTFRSNRGLRPRWRRRGSTGQPLRRRAALEGQVSSPALVIPALQV